MYSLGCVIYAVHCKGSPPFKNHGSLGSLRENAGKSLGGMERLDPDLRGQSSEVPVITTPLNSIVPSTLELAHHPALAQSTISVSAPFARFLFFASYLNTQLP